MGRVPLTQATTMAIFGIGSSQEGIHLWKSNIVKRTKKSGLLPRYLLCGIFKPIARKRSNYLFNYRDTIAQRWSHLSRVFHF